MQPHTALPWESVWWGGRPGRCRDIGRTSRTLLLPSSPCTPRTTQACKKMEPSDGLCPTFFGTRRLHGDKGMRRPPAAYTCSTKEATGADRRLDAELLAMIAMGNQEALGALYRRYSPMLIKLAGNR